MGNVANVHDEPSVEYAAAVVAPAFPATATNVPLPYVTDDQVVELGNVPPAVQVVPLVEILDAVPPLLTATNLLLP